MWHEPIKLEGRFVVLEPMSLDHKEELRLVANEANIWEFTLIRADEKNFDHWFKLECDNQASKKKMPFIARKKDTGKVVGFTTYLNIIPNHKRLEIGSTWLHPSTWGAKINTECKLLLLTHAFEILGANRVEFVTDNLNTRSKKAIEKLGAKHEGVLRANKISQEGRLRDDAVYGIIRSEWDKIKTMLQQKLVS